MRATTVKFLAFTTVMVLIFAGLAIVFSQARFSSTDGYRAVFTNASGLKSGEKVRIAGVPVGTVNGVEVGSDNLAHVSFDVDRKYPLLQSTRATIRYENLVGDRYLELLEGEGSAERLEPKSTIPDSRTAPALDLDLLLGGFKPLLRGLSAEQVNDLSGALLHVLQGQGGTLVSLLGSTSSFTSTLADRDKLIGDVITNLNTTLKTIDDKGDQFSTTVDQLQQLVSGLAQDRDPIGEAIPRIATATDDLAQLLQGARPDLQSTIAHASDLATNLQNGEGDINWVLERLPEAYRKLIRTGSYGAFFQFYTCSVKFKFSGPDGQELHVALPTTPVQTTGRCAFDGGA
ncbi:MCE family protein [Rhodococcus sp. SGAir0479]|uniref:MCE family protein n=1 Tax=Rhodococcus sp. SGAir0479 TaxID=2567884 RepID=UPI0010CD6837|nr:MCE family protein [Rhodococcus sp. SGAir0479]QCQ93698.1 MCE family protein [Rhodococcus sp. SGAir0479]